MTMIGGQGYTNKESQSTSENARGLCIGIQAGVQESTRVEKNID